MATTTDCTTPTRYADLRALYGRTDDEDAAGDEGAARDEKVARHDAELAELRAAVATLTLSVEGLARMVRRQGSTE